MKRLHQIGNRLMPKDFLARFVQVDSRGNRESVPNASAAKLSVQPFLPSSLTFFSV
jgi:hypothetical protein